MHAELTALRQENAALKEQMAAMANGGKEVIEIIDDDNGSDGQTEADEFDMVLTELKAEGQTPQGGIEDDGMERLIKAFFNDKKRKRGKSLYTDSIADVVIVCGYGS